MKKEIVFSFIALGAFILSVLPVKDSAAQARLGVKGGINFADMKYEPQDETNGHPDTKSLQSFHIGAIMDLPITDLFAVQPGVMLNSRGTKAEYHNENLGTYTLKVNPLYVDVPVNLLVTPSIGNGSKFYFGVGPYIGFGVGGKVKFDADTPLGEGQVNHDIKYGSDSNDDLKSTDIGGNVLAGVELGNLLIGAQYGLSFTNNAPKGSDNDNKILRHKVFSVSVGFLFE